MKRTLLVAALILGALLIGSPVAFAENGAGQADAASTPTNCAHRLGTHTYACHVKSSLGADYLDTFTFSQGPFALSVGTLSFPTRCSCGTMGSFIHPKFNASKMDWVCVGNGPTSAVEFQGRVAPNGKITKVIGANSSGETLVVSCALP